MDLGPSPRILITRLSAIGDCITAVPMVCALRDRFPQAMIVWATGAPSESLLRGHSAVDQFLVIPRRWLKSPLQHWRLRRQLRRLRFDVAIDPQSLTKSALLAWYSGAAWRIGFDQPQGRELSVVLNNRRIQPRQTHVVLRQLELLQPLGLPRAQVRFDLPHEPQIEQQMREQLAPLVGPRPFVVLNPGAGWDSRLWPTDRFAEVAFQLGDKLGLPSVVIWAGPRERGWAEQIVAAAGDHAVLAPRTSLKCLAELLRHACLYVGSDTGPTHLAAAVGTPCVCLCGTTRGEVSGPFGSAHMIVQAYYQAGTSRERRAANNDAMLAIDVDRVWSACRRLLQPSTAGAA